MAELRPPPLHPVDENHAQALLDAVSRSLHNQGAAYLRSPYISSEARTELERALAFEGWVVSFEDGVQGGWPYVVMSVTRPPAPPAPPEKPLIGFTQ